MLTRDLNSTTLVRILVRATVAGALMAVVGVVLYKMFGLTALAAVLFAISCGVIRAAWPFACRVIVRSTGGRPHDDR